jgi:hypothetical protein
MGAVAWGVAQLVGVEVGVDTPLWAGLLVGFPLGVNIAAMSTRRLL